MSRAFAGSASLTYHQKLAGYYHVQVTVLRDKSEDRFGKDDIYTLLSVAQAYMQMMKNFSMSNGNSRFFSFYIS